MPGDELEPNPTFLATRAIMIDGTPAAVWPWLLQMGYSRAGFYGYDILENLGSGRGIRSADRILPEFQHFSVGDEVPISAVARMRFQAIEPDRFLIWTGGLDIAEGAFTWALYPVDSRHTRLLSRIRWRHHSAQPDLLVLDLFTEFTDHLAVRKVLRGVKDRVEGRTESMAHQNTEFFILVATALVFLSAVAALILRPLNWQRWLTGAAAGVVWLITWYGPTLAWLALLLVLSVCWALYVHGFCRQVPPGRDETEISP